MVAATTSCSKDDIFDSSVTRTPSNYLASTTDATIDAEGNITLGAKTVYTYDDYNRLNGVVSTQVNIYDGYTFTSTSTGTISYDGDNIYFSALCVDETKDASGNITTDYETSGGCSILDSNNVILSSTGYWSSSYGSDTESFTYDSSNGKVVSYTREANNSTTTAPVIWEGDNIKAIGADIFTYSTTMLNDCNIDLNAFVTNSEELDIFGDCNLLLRDVEGIHSKYMIASCSEEGYTYDVEYTTDSAGRITMAKLDKYGKGAYYVTYFEYYD